MNKSFKFTIALSTVSLIYLYFHKNQLEEYKNNASKKQNQLRKFINNKNNFQKALYKYKSEIPNLNNTIKDIQSDIKKFNFQINPNVEKLSNKINNIKKRI